MPKELHEISQFQTGTVLSPSERDIPDESATYSLNIDPTSKDGVLKGINADTILQYNNGSSDVNIACNAQTIAMVNNKDERHIVFFDPTEDKLRQVPDIYGTPANSNDLSSSSEGNAGTTCMEVNNREVHVGTGGLNYTYPLWAGFVEHKQFGTATNTMIRERGELKNPATFGGIYQWVYLNGYIYGIEYQGTHIFKFREAGKKYLRKSIDIFGSTQGICVYNDKLYVLDNDTANSVTYIKQVETEEMLTEFSSTSNTYLSLASDIHVTNNDTLWISVQHGSLSHITTGALYRIATSSVTAGATLSIVNTTPWCPADTGLDSSLGVGSWRTQANNSSSGTEMAVRFHVPRTALCDINSANKVGWMARVYPINGAGTGVHSGGVAWFQYNGTSNVTNAQRVRYVLMLVKNNQSQAHKINGTDSKIVRLADYSWAFGDSDFTTFQMNSAQGHESSLFFSYGGSTTTSSSTAKQTNSFTVSNISFSSATDWNIALRSETSTVHLPQASINQYEYSSGNTRISAFSAVNGRWATSETYVGAFTKALERRVEMNFFATTETYGSGSATAGTKTGFVTSTTQFYKASLVYDGYQESPLSDDFKTQVVANNGRGIRITLYLRDIDTLSKRISHVNLYRADADNRGSHAEAQGFYRLVKSIPLDASWTLKTDSSTNPAWSDYRYKKIVDTNISGASYEARTGMSEVIDNITPNYGLNTQLNNQHFIGDIYHPTLGELPNYLMKSRPYNFDQFNILADFLVLPTKPTALKSFMGRVYAFDENNIYRIEPNNLYIEDHIEGVGCVDERAIHVNDYGMFFADDNNIYLHDGRKANPIGTSIIKNDSNYAWQSRDKSYKPRASFDQTRKSFMLFFKSPDSKFYCWAYNIERRRWDMWHFDDSDTPKAIVSGKDGQIYVSNGTNIKHYMGGSNLRTWNWKSKKLHMRQNTQDKMFRTIRIEGTPSGTLNTHVKVKINGSDYTATGTITELDIGTRGRTLELEFTGQTGEVDSIGTVYRRYILLSKT